MYIHLMHGKSVNCRMLITFASSLDPKRRLGFKLFDTLIVFMKEFFEKVDFEKKSADDEKTCKIAQQGNSWQSELKKRCIFLVLLAFLSTFVRPLLT